MAVMRRHRLGGAIARVLPHFVCLLLLCLYFFAKNEGALYFGYDGAYMRELVKFHFEWSEPTTNLILNPLQGLSSFTFPINYWFSPASVFSYLVYGTEPNPIAIYTVTTVELFFSIWLLAHCLGASREVQLSSSWSAVILTMPFFVPPHGLFVSFYAISGLIPWIIEHIALSNVMLALILWMQDAKSTRDIAICTAALFASIAYSVIAFPYSVILDGPLVFLFFSFLLFRRPRRLAIWQNIAVVLSLAIGLTTASLFMFSLTIHTVPSFFNDELVYGRPGWIFISILSHGPSKLGWMSSLIFVAGLSGAVVAIFRGSRNLALLSKFYLAYSLFLLLAGVLSTFVFTSYRGPSALYFEWFIWPFMFIYGCYLIEWLVSLFMGLLSPAMRQRLTSTKSLQATISSGLLLPVFFFGAVQAFSKPKAMAAVVAPLQRPPGATQFTKYLQEQVALTPGSAWRGSVATFNGVRPANQGTNWPDNSTYDSRLWQAIGNDHRSFGLWWYGIPTLFAYNQFMPPDYYLVMTRFFAKPTDVQQRSVVVLTRSDTKLLRLFGVRFVISDDRLPENANVTLRQSFEWESVQLRNQFLYEIARPNLGNFAPARQVIEPTAMGAVARMREAQFDPEQHVILQAPIPVTLSDVSQSSVYWEKTGLRVRAKSSGRSLLVLPLQFSHCLEVELKNKTAVAEEPSLIRSDIVLTGVQFSKELDATIRLRFGPFDNVLCRTRDFFEFRQMMLSGPDFSPK